MSKYDPKDAIRHVVHDYAFLVKAAKEKNQKYPLNHYAERTFLTHCRALDDFFNPARTTKTHPDDLHASDFTESKFSPSLPTWKKWRKHINKHLMHLTVGRIKNKTPWDGNPNKAILAEFEATWDKFLDALKPGLKPLFEAELKKY